MKRIAFLTMLSLFVFFSGCKEEKSGRVLNLAHGLNTDHPVHKAMIYMAEKVAEKSDGKLRVEVFPNEQLGNEKECIEALQLGYLAMTKTSSGPMENFVPDIKVYGVPYLFRDADHFWDVMKGPIGKELLLAGEAQGLRGLCYYDAGARSFYAKEPINTPADLAGKKVRVMSSMMAMDMINHMGGSPTPISWGELYTSLDQGLVDAAENNPPSFNTSGHYEICSYYSLDEHTRLPDMLVMSSEIWDALNPEEQQIVSEAVAESVEYQIDLWAKAETNSMEKVADAGVQIIRPDKAPFREAVKPMWERYDGTRIGELIEQIQEVQ